MDVAAVTAACADLQIPARTKAAEAVLQEFAASEQVIPTCKHILEISHPSDILVQFHISNILRESAIRNFTSLSKQDVANLINFLLAHTLRQQPEDLNVKINSIVLNKLAQAIAALMKRGWLESSQEDKHAFFQGLEKLRGGNVFERQISLNILDQLLGEFSANATAAGLPWDFHNSCRKSFEEGELSRLFQMTLELLHHYIINPHVLQNNGEYYCAIHCCCIALKVLRWEFVSLGKAMAGSFESMVNAEDSDGQSQLPVYWSNIILRPDVIDIFFKIHPLLVSQDTSGVVDSCLRQLCSITGPVLSSADAEISYVRHLVQSVTHFMRNGGSEYDEQLVSISLLIKRLLTTYKLSTFGSIPSQEFYPFLTDCGELTLRCIQNMKTENILDEELWNTEAAELLLDVWASLIVKIQAYIDDPPQTQTVDIPSLVSFMTSISHPIFSHYLDSKLAKTEQQVDEDDEEEFDGGMDDLLMFGDQLLYMAVIGRLDPGKSLPLVQSLLEDRLERLKGIMATGTIVDEHYCKTPFEHIHWLALIAGHLLADAGEGEVPMIPRLLMEFSSKMQGAGADPVVALPSVIFNILSLTTVAPHSRLANICSPQVAETLIWFLKRWCQSYLLFDGSQYSTVSPSLISAFSGSGTGPQLFDQVIQLAYQNFVQWSGDLDVLTADIDLLQMLASRSGTRDRLLQSSHFQEMIHYFLKSLNDLPSVTHSALIRVVGTVATRGSHTELESQFLQTLTKTLETNLSQVLHHPDFMRLYQSHEVKFQVINTLEMYDGLAQCADSNNANVIFNIVAAYFEAFAQLFVVYHEVVEVNYYILKLYSEVVKILEFDGIHAESRALLCTSYNRILKSHASSYVGLKTGQFREDDVEDEIYQDLSMILGTLSSFLMSDVKDATLVDTVFFGVNSILPLITTKMLQYPKLCRDYIRLIGHLVEHFPDKLVSLPDSVVSAFMDSIKYGTEQTAFEVQRGAFEAITGVTRFSIRQRATSGGLQSVNVIIPHLDTMLHHILNYMLFKEFNHELVEPAGEALLSLILLRQRTYHSLITQILSTQPTQELQTRLQTSFQALNACIESAARSDPSVAGMSGHMDKSAFRVFHDGLSKFLMNVRGFLRVR